MPFKKGKLGNYLFAFKFSFFFLFSLRQGFSV